MKKLKDLDNYKLEQPLETELQKEWLGNFYKDMDISIMDYLKDYLNAHLNDIKKDIDDTLKEDDRFEKWQED